MPKRRPTFRRYVRISFQNFFTFTISSSVVPEFARILWPSSLDILSLFSCFTDQDDVFEAVGRGVLENAFQGYNACIFAYGQTGITLGGAALSCQLICPCSCSGKPNQLTIGCWVGSGKSYTMMGTNDQPGVIPRLCRNLFHRVETDPSSTTSYKVEVSYMEIYNEKVYDLLNPRGLAGQYFK